MAFYSATLVGVKPIPVEIEIDISPGLPFFQIVGLPDAVLRESKTRVKSAILQSGFEFPYDQRVVLNLAPSEVKKEGSGFELGLAARILTSSNQVSNPDFNILFLGELALDGKIRSIPEVEALAYSAHSHFSGGVKLDLIVVSEADVSKISQLKIKVLGLRHLCDLKLQNWWSVDFPLTVGSSSTTDPQRPVCQYSPEIGDRKNADLSTQFEKLRFSEFWGRHLMIAALGGHHYFLCGPPGTGKTFFAESLRTVLSLLSDGLEVERRLLNSIFKRSPMELPFAAPHHSASMAGILGGGNPPRAGAVTRTHGGILFLDELLEFSTSSLDGLREPVERGVVEIFRAGSQVTFPSRFQLVAATNPCRCGYWKDKTNACRCMPHIRKAYLGRMSGPFFERFDVKIFCERRKGNEKLVSGKEILSKIGRIKTQDFKPRWTPSVSKLLDEKADKGQFNLRTFEKVKKLCFTLAQIDGQPSITPKIITEATRYQAFGGLDRPF